MKISPKLRPYLAATPGFRRGDDDPRSYLERCLAVIAAREPEVEAFVNLDLDAARTEADLSARRWREERTLSPIDGMPIGIKDIIETIDMPTENGSPLFRGWRSNRDAASVAALREAGAIIVGKTVTTEFAATYPGKTHNPWDPRRTPGGSSSGSAAATGCGMISAGLGTQVIGSILRPASYCGCVGFKPSLGSINRGGSHDYLSQSCVGILAADLDDAWCVLREISARVGGDPGFFGLSGPMTIPVPQRPRALAFLQTSGWPQAADAAKRELERALASLASAGVNVCSAADDPLLAEVETAIVDATKLSRAINAWESRWPLNTYARRDRSGLSAVMQERLAVAEQMSLEDYQHLLEERNRVRTLYARLARDYDALVTLAAPGPAPLGLQSTGDPIFAIPSSLLGAPALSLPVLECEGLPLGLQLMGFPGADRSLVETGCWVQPVVTAWSTK